MNDTETIMNQLAAELKKKNPDQKQIDRLNKQLDKALGTELKDEDTVMAERWERSLRAYDDSL